LLSHARAVNAFNRAAKRQKEEEAKTICGYTDENNRCRLLDICEYACIVCVAVSVVVICQ
jgi:hypothetical protein